MQQEKEIFQNYEIKNFEFTPFFYKLLGGVAVFNILTILVVGQTNLLTRKGCDSPMVSRVCQVLDTVYVGSVLLGTERDYVDKDYTKTELADADITYIDVSGQEPPLTYPEGYFALANPEDNFAAMQTMPTDFSTFSNPTANFPTIPPPTGGMDLLNTPQVTPTPNKNVVTGPIPTSPFSMSDVNPVPPPMKTGKSPRISTPKMPRITKNTLPNPVPSPDDKDTVAENNPTETKQPEPKSDPITEVEINKRPIKDLGVFVNKLLKDEKDKLNLESPFVATATGKLTKDGKLDPKTYKIEAKSDDKKMVEVVQESIEAINDAGYLQYLKDLSGKDLSLMLQQDDKGITAVVQSELKNIDEANKIKNGLNLAISIAKLTKTDPNDKDDLELLNGASVENDGKKIIIKFAIPNPLAQEMIKRKLLEQETKPQTNNTAQVNTSQTITK